MTFVPTVLGLMLGLGLWIAFNGFQAMRDPARAEPERRKGLWRLNLGAICAVASMIGIMWLQRG